MKDGSIVMDQQKYVESLLKEFRLEDAKPLERLMEIKEGSTPFNGPYLERDR
eukprot:Awhi_evm1s3798